jgi:glycosyltransferase involved in cell wall biosynthesis
VLVSNFWPSTTKGGVALSAERHAKLLLKAGYFVSIIGSNPKILEEKLPLNKYFIKARGSGSLYSPAIVNKKKIREMLVDIKPSLIIIEGWQTAITDGFIDVAFDLQIDVMLISHGISLHPFTSGMIDLCRSLGWVFYKNFLFPKKLRKLSYLTCLDDNSISSRFYDRDLARYLGLTVTVLPNSPVNFSKIFFNRQSRRSIIVVAGYFSRIKNQLAAIRLIKKLPTELSLHLIGHRSGYYYLMCKWLVYNLGLEDRVKFLDDSDCALEAEIGKSLLVLSTSITEVQPLVILEAMASGTPYVARPIGGVINLCGGILAADEDEQLKAILSIYRDEQLWQKLSYEGLELSKNYFSDKVTEKEFNRIVNDALLAKGSIYD